MSPSNASRIMFWLILGLIVALNCLILGTFWISAARTEKAERAKNDLMLPEEKCELMQQKNHQKEIQNLIDQEDAFQICQHCSAECCGASRSASSENLENEESSQKIQQHQ